MGKIAIIILLCFFISKGVWADELKHIIRDGENWYPGIFEERTTCVGGEEHLFIELSKEDWCKIGGWDSNTIQTHFYADICIRCRLIRVSCNGSDSFRYIITKEEEK